jgi:tetratricopeptide (TPR) repeat protein
LTRTRKEQELSDAISMGIKSNKLEDWENALKWWEIAIGRDSETISTYSKEISVAMCEKAELFYEKKQFIEAINLFEKAKEKNKNIFDDYGENYSNLLFSYGVKQIDDSEFETGLVSLNYSCFLSDVNRPKIENKLNSLKRSWALSTSLSIIPGLSQTIYQKGKTKPAILFTTFSLSSLVGIYNSISADHYYRDYLNSDTPDDAETNFYKAEERLKTSKIYFGVAIATIIYSVIDQFIDTSNYNSFFEISDSYSTAFQTTDNFSVSLNIRF